MADQDFSRREFLRDTVLATTLAAGMSGATQAGTSRLHVACNQYPWSVFYGRDGKDFNALLDAGLAEVAASGIDGFEPGVGGLQQIEQMAPLLKKNGLEMRSLYVNSTLHEADQADTTGSSVY